MRAYLSLLALNSLSAVASFTNHHRHQLTPTGWTSHTRPKSTLHSEPHQRSSPEQLPTQQSQNPDAHGYINSVSDMEYDLPATSKASLERIPGLPGAGTIVSENDPFATRYLVPLTIPEGEVNESAQVNAAYTYVMVDVPPFSKKLVLEMQTFMATRGRRIREKEFTEEDEENEDDDEPEIVEPSSETIASMAPLAILITSKNTIHYPQAEAVYSIRRSELLQWIAVFPNIQIVMHRLDLPRNVRMDLQSLAGNNLQILDGAGPYGWEYDKQSTKLPTFKELGPELKLLDWDYDKINDLYDDENPLNATQIAMDEAETDGTSPRIPTPIELQISQHPLIAVHTPGHTSGSISYLLPQSRVCASGSTLPDGTAHYQYDSRGILSTNEGGLETQGRSGRRLVEDYGGVIQCVLPTKGEILEVEGFTDEELRVGFWEEILGQFDKVSRVYKRLGIVGQ